MRFIIPYPPTKAGRSQWAREYGLNAYWAGKHWARRKQDAEYWHSMVRSELRKQGIKPRMVAGPVELRFWFNDRLDCSNHAAMVKMTEDALKGVLIADDSRKYVKKITTAFHDENFILVEVKQCGR